MNMFKMQLLNVFSAWEVVKLAQHYKERSSLSQYLSSHSYDQIRERMNPEGGLKLMLHKLLYEKKLRIGLAYVLKILSPHQVVTVATELVARPNQYHREWVMLHFATSRDGISIPSLKSVEDTMILYSSEQGWAVRNSCPRELRLLSEIPNAKRRRTSENASEARCKCTSAYCYLHYYSATEVCHVQNQDFVLLPTLFRVTVQ